MTPVNQEATSSGLNKPAHRRPYGWTWFPSPRSRHRGRPSLAQSKIEPSSEYTSGCIHAGNRLAIIAERKPTEQYSTVLVRPRMETSEARSATPCKFMASGRWLMANSSGDRTSINRIACPGLSSHPANVAVSTRFTSGNADRTMRLILPVSAIRSPRTRQGINEIIGNTTFSLIFSKAALASFHSTLSEKTPSLEDNTEYNRTIFQQLRIFRLSAIPEVEEQKQEFAVTAAVRQTTLADSKLYSRLA
jgi:hypothetical protein